MQTAGTEWFYAFMMGMSKRAGGDVILAPLSGMRRQPWPRPPLSGQIASPEQRAKSEAR